MKMTTQVWAKLENKGKPADTIKFEGTNREVVLKFANWLGEVYMGNYLRLTIARSEVELEAATTRGNSNIAETNDLMGELEQFLDTLPESGEE